MGESEDLNLEFIIEMAYLRDFYTDLNVVYSEKFNLNNLKRLETFYFKVGNKEFKLKKKNIGRYNMSFFK